MPSNGSASFVPTASPATPLYLLDFTVRSMFGETDEPQPFAGSDSHAQCIWSAAFANFGADPVYQGPCTVSRIFQLITGVDVLIDTLQDVVPIALLEAGGVFVLTGDNDVLVLLMEERVATTQRDGVVVEAEHVVVNGDEPVTPVVFVYDKIINLLHQTLIAEAVVTEDKIIGVHLQLRFVTSFHVVAHALQFLPQFVHVAFPFRCHVIRCPPFHAVIGNLDFDAFDEKLHEPQGELLDLSFVVLGLFYHRLEDVLRDGVVAVHDDVIKLLNAVVEVAFVLVDKVVFFVLACLAFNFVNSVEIVFRRPDLSLVGAIADDNGAPVDGVLDFLEF